MQSIKFVLIFRSHDSIDRNPDLNMDGTSPGNVDDFNVFGDIGQDNLLLETIMEDSKELYDGTYSMYPGNDVKSREAE